MMLIGLPRTLPPKSSTAIWAAVTEPCPVGVEAGPVMSVSTPILTIPSEICAEAHEAQPNKIPSEAAAIRLFRRMHPSLKLVQTLFYSGEVRAVLRRSVLCRHGGSSLDEIADTEMRHVRD